MHLPLMGCPCKTSGKATPAGYYGKAGLCAWCEVFCYHYTQFYVASQDNGTVVRKIQVVCEASLCSLNGAKTSEAGSHPADA